MNDINSFDNDDGVEQMQPEQTQPESLTVQQLPTQSSSNSQAINPNFADWLEELRERAKERQNNEEDISSGIPNSTQQTFAQANESETNTAQPLLTQSSLDKSNEEELAPEVAEPNMPSLRPGEYVEHGFVLHKMRIMLPSVQKKREAREQRNENKKRVAAAMMEAMNEPDVVYECKCSVCKINNIDTHCASCGHLCCRQCWNKWLPSFRKIMEKKLDDDDDEMIEEVMKTPACMFCRKPVESLSRAFYS